MNNNQHTYNITNEWTGNKGTGTSAYRAYERSHTILAADRPEILCTSDPAFRGDKTKYNPELLLVASLSSCHMLWYLHLCSEAGIIVTSYIDNATGTMIETANGNGHFTKVTLQPTITINDIALVDKANELHKKANELCFIANSVNFPVHHNATYKTSAQ